MLVAGGQTRSGESSGVRSAEGSWKCVRVYQEPPVVKRDLVLECGSLQCSQAKAEMLENLKEWWQQGGISEGQAEDSTIVSLYKGKGVALEQKIANASDCLTRS